MATYLQGVSDSPESFHTSLYTPDFSFLANNQQKKDLQYKEGLSEVAQGYNAILNAPVTDDANKVVKDGYIKTAQEGLQKLSTSDLSLPKNVAQAETLYAPFWKDNILLQDIAYTKQAANKIQTAFSYRDSKDKEQRDMFDPDAVTYIQQGLNKLKGANRDQSAYNKLENRDFIPVHDIDAEIDTAYKLEGQKGITYTDQYGATQVVSTNGIRSKDAFRTYYLSKVGNKYDAQIRMKASVQIQREKDEILSHNPGLDERDLNDHFATEQMDALNRNYSGMQSSYQKLADNFKLQAKLITDQIAGNQHGIGNEYQYSKLRYLNDQITQHEKAATEYGNKYQSIGSGNVNSQQYQKTFNDIAEHPQQYIGDIHKQFMADRWASGMASMSSVEVKADQAWMNYNTAKINEKNAELREAEIATTQRGQNLGLYEKTGTLEPFGKQDPRFTPNGWGGGTGTTGPGTGGAQVGTGIEGGSILGRGTVYPAHLANGLDVYNEAQNRQHGAIHANVFNPNGVAGALTASGLPTSTIIDFTEWANSAASGKIPSKEQSAALEAVQKVLNDGGIKYDNTVDGMRDALLSYTPKAIEQIMSSTNDNKVEQAAKVIVANMNATYARDKYTANQKEFETAKQAEIYNNPEYSKLVTTDSHNRKRLVTTEDMAKDFPSIQLGGNDGKVVQEYSPVQFAKLYKEGRVHIAGGNSIFIDDKPFNIVGVNGKVKNWAGMASADLNELYYSSHSGKNSLQSKYGTSEELASLEKKAAQAVLPKLKETKDGMIVQEIGWDPTDKNQLPVAAGISKELANPANVPLVYQQGTDNSIGNPIEGKQLAAIRNIMSTQEDIKDYTTGPVKITTPDGKEAYKITFRSNSTTDKQVADGYSTKDLAGKTFILPLSDNASAPFINSVPKSTATMVYGSLLDGKEIKADPVTKSGGFDYLIKPYNPGADGRMTMAYVTITRTVPDPLHPGQTKPDNVEFTVPLSGDGAKTADELIKFMQGRIVTHMAETVSNTKTANAQQPQHSTTLAEFNKQEQQRLQQQQ